MASIAKLASASSRITLLAGFIAVSALMPSGCWAQSTMNTTFHSNFLEGDIRVVVGPNRNQIRVQAYMPDWAKAVTPKQEYIVETYLFPSNNGTTVTEQQAIPANLAQIGSECTETDNGKLRGYICSTDEGADVTVAQAFGSPPVVNGGGTSVGFLYTEMFVRQPAGSTMRLPSVRVDPLAMKGIGYIMVPSKGPAPLPGTFDAMPFIAGNDSKASLATTPFSSNTVQTVAPTAFPGLSMSAPANQSLTLNATIIPPAAAGAAAGAAPSSYNISLYISKDALPVRLSLSRGEF
ncbi:unnamed protein product [Closterium sp. Naga37s-1]|nr:unnamed protein product [Closterium sp. Naga37s-1]